MTTHAHKATTGTEAALCGRCESDTETIGQRAVAPPRSSADADRLRPEARAKWEPPEGGAKWEPPEGGAKWEPPGLRA